MEILRSTEKCDIVKISEDEVQFLAGSRDAARKKVCRVSQAEIDVDERDLTLTISGSKSIRLRALRYIEIVRAQKSTNQISIEDYTAQFHHDSLQLFEERESSEQDPDYTLLELATNVVPHVSGKRGHLYRELESEFSTLICPIQQLDPKTITLAIFSPDPRARKATELRILANLEKKVESYVCSRLPKKDVIDVNLKFGCDIIKYSSDFFFFLKSHLTYIRQLRKCANCIIEFMGSHGVFAGTKNERSKARFYVEMLGIPANKLPRNDLSKNSIDIQNRNDVSVVYVPRQSLSRITNRRFLEFVEANFGVLCFFFQHEEDPDIPITIFGQLRMRTSAEIAIMKFIDSCQPNFYKSDLEAGMSRALRKHTELDFKPRLLSTGSCNLALQQQDEQKDAFLTDILPLDYSLEQEIQKLNSNKRRILKASNSSALEILGNFVLISGAAKERRRARWCISWLLQQFSKDDSFVEPMKEFARVVQIRDLPEAFLASMKKSLKSVEQKCGNVVCLMGLTEVAVCGINARERQYADEMITKLVDDLPELPDKAKWEGETDDSSDFETFSSSESDERGRRRRLT